MGEQLPELLNALVPKLTSATTPFRDETQYLAFHFLVMREDCVRPVREALRTLREHPDMRVGGNGRAQNSGHRIRTFPNARLLSISVCGQRDKYLCYTFSVSANSKRKNAGSSSGVVNKSAFKTGALICASTVKDFDTLHCGMVIDRVDQPRDKSTHVQLLMSLPNEDDYESLAELSAVEWNLVCTGSFFFFFFF